MASCSCVIAANVPDLPSSPHHPSETFSFPKYIFWVLWKNYMAWPLKYSLLRACCGYAYYLVEVTLLLWYTTQRLTKHYRHLTLNSHNLSQTVLYVQSWDVINLRLSDSPCSKPNPKPTQQQPGIARKFCVTMWQLCCTQHTKHQDHNVHQQQPLKETENEYPQSLVFASVSVLHIIFHMTMRC